MSTDPTTPGAGTPEVPTTPTVTAFQQLADTYIKQVEEWSANFPGLQVQHPAIAHFTRFHQNVPTDFVSSAVSAAEQSPALQGIMDTSAVRGDLQYIEAFKPLVDSLTSLRDALDYTIRAKRASLGLLALQTYGAAKSIARNRDTVTLTHVANMQRDLKRKGIGNKKSDSTPTPTPTPQPPTPSTEA